VVGEEKAEEKRDLMSSKSRTRSLTVSARCDPRRYYFVGRTIWSAMGMGWLWLWLCGAVLRSEDTMRRWCREYYSAPSKSKQLLGKAPWYNKNERVNAASGVIPLRHFAPLPRLRFACVSPRTLLYSTCYRTMTHE
jgi:hypothetical protein